MNSPDVLLRDHFFWMLVWFIAASPLWIAGLIAMAVANEVVIADPLEHPSVILSVLLYGGPVLFLLAQGWYEWFLPQVWPRMRLT